MSNYVLYGKKREVGVTLIELMIVVAIVAILSVYMVGGYRESQERGNRTDCTSFAYSLASRQERFFAQEVSYTSDIIGAAGLNLGVGGDISPNKKCAAVIDVTPDGCDPVGGPRCSGFVIRVSRGTVDLPAPSDLACSEFTLSHLGEKDVGASDTLPAESCWR